MSHQKHKKASTPWLQCEKCLTHIINKDIDKHSSDCPPNLNNYNFVQNEVLFGHLDIKVNEEIKGIVDTDSLVFLSQSAIQLCGLSIGEWALIEFDNSPPVAKVVWPTTEKSTTSVLLTKHGTHYYLVIHHFKILFQH